MDSECGPSYDDHAWQWQNGQHVCQRCGLVDLSAQRLKRRLLDRIAAAGWRIG